MELDIASFLFANLIFSVHIAPIVVIAATVIRVAILLMGQKREFEQWTRNKYMTLFSWLFFPGMIAYVTLRWAVNKLLRVDMDGIGMSTTYGELNLFLSVDRPPHTGIVLAALFLAIVLQVFIAFSMIFLPVAFVLGSVPTLLLWYIALSVLVHNSLRSGDLSLVGASLREHPKSGALELILFLVALVYLYTQVLGVLV